MPPVYHEEKFKELILYVAARMDEDPSFGATKLNKVLYFADVLHYVQYGQAITGAVYMKLPYGPAPRRLLPVQAEMIDDGEAVMRRLQVGSFVQKRLVPLRAPNLSLFSGTEIAMVDEVISRLGRFNALGVSDLSHGMLGWQIAPEGHTIPYESIFLYDGPVTAADEFYAKEIASDLGEQLAAAGITAP